MSAEWFHAKLTEGEVPDSDEAVFVAEALDPLARNVGCVRVGPWERVTVDTWRCLAKRAEVSA